MKDDGDKVQEQIRLIAAGDVQAAADFCERYKTQLTAWARAGLPDWRMRKAVGDSDVVQSAIGNFIQALQNGRHYEMTTLAQVLGLLHFIIGNKAKQKIRDEHAGLRDNRLLDPAGMDGLDNEPGWQETPSAGVMHAELDETAKSLAQQVRTDFSDEQWSLVLRNLSGCSYAKLAAECGRSPEAIRKQCDRLIAEMREAYARRVAKLDLSASQWAYLIRKVAEHFQAKGSAS